MKRFIQFDLNGWIFELCWLTLMTVQKHITKNLINTIENNVTGTVKFK